MNRKLTFAALLVTLCVPAYALQSPADTSGTSLRNPVMVAQAGKPSGSPAAKTAGTADKTAKPEVKAQSAEASKTVKLGMVAASDAKVKAALVATNLDGAKKAAGKPGAFVGTVTNIHMGSGNRITILNFDPDYKKALTAVIFPASYAKLPDLETLKGKKLMISGKITEFHDSYEVIVDGPDQIKIVK